MTKEENLESAKDFPVGEATLSLWAFKKKVSGGFTARAVNTTEQLTTALKTIVSSSLQRYTEVDEYDLLAQVNEVGCLHVEEDETIFEQLKALVDQPAEENLIQTTKHLDNSAGYLVKLHSDGRTLYCVKKVNDAWIAKKAANMLNVVLNANQLELVEGRSLTISNDFDFFVIDGGVLIARKLAFESLLNYKLEYQNSFDALQQDAQFSALFVDMAPLVAHVGTNTMHLRRMAVIEQRGHYADAAYMQRLRTVNAQKNWGIEFDPSGRIVASDASLRTIMQVLLNHRLYSELSLGTFDVPSAAQVA